MFKLMGKKIITILSSKNFLSGPISLGQKNKYVCLLFDENFKQGRLVDFLFLFYFYFLFNLK